MDLNFSDHARLEMAAEGITQAMVQAVLDNPTWQVPTTGNTRYDAIVEGRRIGVVVAEGRIPVLVVTAFVVTDQE